MRRKSVGAAGGLLGERRVEGPGAVGQAAVV
jgi:hypothetical protein